MQIYMLLLLLRKSLHLPVVKEPVKVVLPIFSVVSIIIIMKVIATKTSISSYYFLCWA